MKKQGKRKKKQRKKNKKEERKKNKNEERKKRRNKKKHLFREINQSNNEKWIHPRSKKHWMQLLPNYFVSTGE